MARAAAIAAVTTGLVAEVVAEESFGFCHFAARPGELVALDSFYIGNLKGVGKVYQLTAVDTATRWAIIAIVYAPVTGAISAHFVASVVKRFRNLGVSVGAVLTDNGPEWADSRDPRNDSVSQRPCVDSIGRLRSGTSSEC